MPITYAIDRTRRTVYAGASGVLTPRDLFTYQNEVWSAPELRGYNECVDMLAVTDIEGATDSNMKALAELSARMDDPLAKSKFAIIAREDLHYGLARMYEAYRSMQPMNTRTLAIFRTREDALRWLSGESTAS
ncbi:MAG: hypothetical protein HGB21_07130 [Nitrospirae bacterium]|nr:hypothetical protein [Nitrospirota bacterium]NTW66069.1 hypothetical protein [Nitrospirota bacterium]